VNIDFKKEDKRPNGIAQAVESL